ncbi:MAG: hypothetical protein HXX13_15820 [Bacteroidetes bacterium]|nr:hypothetical protein [Bacteroidota bacterium]
MDRRYTILAILLIIAASGLLFLPDRSKPKEINPQELLAAIDDPARFISTDQVTERIIGADPALQLIDVRSPEEFRKFAMQGAINIPIDSLLIPQFKDVLTQAGKDKVFYSSSDLAADEAWQICRRTSVPRIYVMKGGLNEWFNTIMKCSEPNATAPSQDIDLYHFRLAARQYFTGGSQLNSGQREGNSGASDKKAEEVKVVKKETKTGGGC